MADKRPKHLLDNIRNRMEKNDISLSNALDTLQNRALNANVKVTLKELRNLCDMSEGAIRSREWAMIRLKEIKEQTRSQRKKANKVPLDKSEVQILRQRVKDLLKENAILFNEIIGLQEQLSRREREITALNSRIKIAIDNTPRKK